MTAFRSVPVIDVAALRSGTPDQQRAVAERLGDAARDVGFLHVTGHGVPAELYDAVLAAAQAFFRLPQQDKDALHIARSACHRGYVPAGEEVFGSGTRDLKEAFDLALDLPAHAPEVLADPMLGPNRWPDLPGFREAVTAWYEAVLALGDDLARGFALALGQPEDALTRHVTTPPSQLRLLHYPHDPSAVDSVGIGAHTDYELFTLLRSTSPGLEVRSGDGTWVDAPPREDAFLVNVGDMLETWSGGRYVATTHRVRKVAQERWSFPLFFSLDSSTVVRPFDRPDAPGLTAGEHLFAQTAQTFTYLREQVERGELVLPSAARPLDSFGRREART